MPRNISIACLQTAPQPDFSSALDMALALGEEAVDKGAEFLALPEYCGGLISEGAAIAPPFAAEDEHPVLLGLQNFARDRKVWVAIGSIAVPGPAGKIFNRGFVVNPAGDIVSRYTKIHLFDIQLSEDEVYKESATVQGGDEAIITRTPFAKLGHSICYDLRFVGLYRQLARAGAEILMVPAAFTKKTGEAHWHILNRARAIENGAFVVAPCAIGEIEGGGECYGHSLIVGPWGEVLADGGAGTGIAMATIDLDEVAAACAKIPNIAHDPSYAAPKTLP